LYDLWESIINIQLFILLCGWGGGHFADSSIGWTVCTVKNINLPYNQNEMISSPTRTSNHTTPFSRGLQFYSSYFYAFYGRRNGRKTHVHSSIHSFIPFLNYAYKTHFISCHCLLSIFFLFFRILNIIQYNLILFDFY